MANKHIDLFKEIIPSVDMGFKELWDAADDDGKKDIKGDLWNLNRYISSVGGNFEKQALAVVKVNEYYNKNWNSITQHPKLQWQLLCIAGKTNKKEFHTWIKLERTANSNNKSVKLLAEIYPNMKFDEVELLARISTKKEIKELAREHGYEKVDI
tara:strand:+ start:641 stop:1105 length:465 start_codon:yes stop_codon:yes gene_type:complete